MEQITRVFDAVIKWIETNYVVIIYFAVLLLIVAVYLWYRHRKQTPKTSDILQNREANTEIEDEVLGTVFEYIDWQDKPPGYPLLDNSKYYYYMRRPRGIKFIPNEDGSMPDYSMYSLNMPREMGILPEFLWRATHRPTELVPVLFELPPPEWIMSIMKYAIIALAIGALIFVVASGKK